MRAIRDLFGGLVRSVPERSCVEKGQARQDHASEKGEEKSKTGNIVHQQKGSCARSPG